MHTMKYMQEYDQEHRRQGGRILEDRFLQVFSKNMKKCYSEKEMGL